MGDGALGVIALIGLVAIILNIILFFKVWGMTNNVIKLTKIAQKFTSMDTNIDFAERIKLTEEEKIKDTLI